jgi:citrate/tricarballylate utilization protein
LIAFAIGFARFWRRSGESLSSFLHPGALAQALKDVLTLHYLDGGGGGCTYPAAQQSQSRRWFHHLTFYGFALCFASTTTAAFYHYLLNLRAPYPYTSLPVVLGTTGGVALITGTIGLLLLKFRRNPDTQDGNQTGMDLSFLLLLLLTSATGIALLAFRASARMPELLYLHLAFVFVLFLTLPYGKFVHAIYRSAALVKSALEAQRGIHR